MASVAVSDNTCSTSCAGQLPSGGDESVPAGTGQEEETDEEALALGMRAVFAKHNRSLLGNQRLTGLLAICRVSSIFEHELVIRSNCLERRYRSSSEGR